MHAISEALGSLDEPTVARVLRWAADRYGVVVTSSPKSPPDAKNDDEDPNAPRNGKAAGAYADIADLYDAANPQTGPEKALVGAYWHQVVEAQPDFGALEINNSLKHLGHAVSNITRDLTALINRKPRLVMQTHKAGKSVQARKRYKLTREGTRAVEAMIKPGLKGSS